MVTTNFSTFLLITSFVILPAFSDDGPAQYSIQFIKKSCGTTTYPFLCFKTLSAHAYSIQTSQKMLAQLALHVALTRAKFTAAQISNMSKASHVVRAQEAAAVHDCIEVVHDSAELIRESLAQFEHGKCSDLKMRISNAVTWLSAALSDQDTCVMGFDEMEENGEIGKMVKRYIVQVAHLTSNALALVNTYAATRI